MILNEGDVVLVSHRRMFERDESRYFLGRVKTSEGDLLKVEGFTFVRDLSNGLVIKKEELRTRVLSLVSAGHIVYQLSNDIDINQAQIKGGSGDVVLIDGIHQIMNLSERSHCGHF
jgi:hypothetical protein